MAALLEYSKLDPHLEESLDWQLVDLPSEPVLRRQVVLLAPKFHYPQAEFLWEDFLHPWLADPMKLVLHLMVARPGLLDQRPDPLEERVIPEAVLWKSLRQVLRPVLGLALWQPHLEKLTVAQWVL